jgi:Flp pilus assembly protein TadG
MSYQKLWNCTCRSLSRFLGNRRGNIAILFALSAIPLTLAVGMAIDYGVAGGKRSKMNAAADAAALSAIARPMMMRSLSNAQTAAINLFNAHVAGIANIIYDPASDLKVTVSQSDGNRIATVSYTAESLNVFGGILNYPTTTISNTVQASTAIHDVDFYLLIDTSPSMAIPATTTGIQQMTSLTPQQGGGCAFACHESNPQADNLGNPNGEDNYALARDPQYNIQLRIDLVKDAINNLISSIQTMQQPGGAVYRVGLNTFDSTFNTIAAISGDMSAVLSQASNMQMLEVSSFYHLTPTIANQDTDTNWDTAISDINALIPDPGDGAPSPGHSPKEVLFIITDGVEDELIDGQRLETVMNPAVCQTIQNRQILVAVLYTTYQQLPPNPTVSNVSGLLPYIGPALQRCASPGLYFEVSTDQSISDALATLFARAVSATQTARLTQ